MRRRESGKSQSRVHKHDHNAGPGSAFAVSAISVGSLYLRHQSLSIEVSIIRAGRGVCMASAQTNPARHILPSAGALLVYLPLNRAVRFSRNADMPSCLSSVP
jgi:hypothetical protein